MAVIYTKQQLTWPRKKVCNFPYDRHDLSHWKQVLQFCTNSPGLFMLDSGYTLVRLITTL